MAANLLIYGNDIGDTARADLARRQIMDQRSRDAAAQRQGTAARMQQNKQFGAQLNQQDQQFWANQQMRGRELEEQRNFREALEREDREARAQIAQEQRESALIESARRAAENGMLSEDDIAGILPQVGPRAQSILKGLGESVRMQKQREFDILKSEADRINAIQAPKKAQFEEGTLKPGFAWDSWGYRTEGEAAKQNAERKAAYDAQVAQEMGNVDPDLRMGLRYDPLTGNIVPNIAPPASRTQREVVMPSIDGGGMFRTQPQGMIAPRIVNPLAPPPSPAAPAPAAAAGPAPGLGFTDQDWGAVQSLVQQLAPRMGREAATILAIDRVRKAAAAAAATSLPAEPTGQRVNPNSGFGWF